MLYSYQHNACRLFSNWTSHSTISGQSLLQVSTSLGQTFDGWYILAQIITFSDWCMNFLSFISWIVLFCTCTCLVNVIHSNTPIWYPILHEFLLYMEFWKKFHCCGEWLKLLLQTDCSASDDSDDTDSTDLSICFEVNGAAVVPSINPSSLSDDTVSSISEWCIPNISLATNFSSANAHLSDALGSLLLNWKHVKISISRFL